MKNDWQARLSSYFADPKTRIALIGLGNAMMGDDAAGLLLAQHLEKFLPRERFLVLEAGLAPENILGILRSFHPNLVILMDLVIASGKAGAILWLNPSVADGCSASTHSLPLSIVAEYLVAEYQCEVFVLAITAQSLKEATALSEHVEKAVEEIRHYVAGLVSNSCS